jgi:xanthine/CO dehydrogenase XdhC/CoxF family maturation factor
MMRPDAHVAVFVCICWRFGANVVLGSADALARNVDLKNFDVAVVMSHHLPSDASYLAALAQSKIAYIGLLGPKARREKIFVEIGGLSAQIVPRLRSPVGLDIGAVTPEGIALAITGELHAFAARRDYQSLNWNALVNAQDLSGHSTSPM